MEAAIFPLCGIDVMVISCDIIEYTKVKVAKSTSDFGYRLSSIPVAQLTGTDTLSNNLL